MAVELLSAAGEAEATVSDAKQRVLDMAEQLFMERGYAAVTLRDIADALGIRQASLYYHFPDGKEQLYVAMAERVFERHRQGMTQAIASAGLELGAQLAAVARWFGSQPALNFIGMMHADMPALSPASAAELSRAAYAAMFEPLRQAFQAAHDRGESRHVHLDLLAGSFLALMDGVTVSASQQRNMPREIMSAEVIDLLLNGLRPR
jgi:AcrR family transcriptional regulator